MTSFAASTGPLLFAHRGARWVEPENTLEAFAAALRAGADAIETDAWLSRDGHVMLCHDGHGTRCAGEPAELRACTLAELKRWDLRRSLPERKPHPVRMPTLDEALAAFPNALFNVDVKQQRPDMLVPLLATIARHAAEPRVLLTSFSARTTRRIRKLGYSGPIGVAQLEAVYCLLGPMTLAQRFPVRAQRLQIPVAQPPLRLDGANVIDRAHALGLAVDYWVINDADHATRLLALGADGIVTDDPQAMAGVFARAPETGAWRNRHAAGG